MDSTNKLKPKHGLIQVCTCEWGLNIFNTCDVRAQVKEEHSERRKAGRVCKDTYYLERREKAHSE